MRIYGEEYKPSVGSNSSWLPSLAVLAILRDRYVKLTDGAENFLSSSAGILQILCMEFLPASAQAE